MDIHPAANIDSTWDYISEGINVLMIGDLAKGGLSPEAYMKMYTAVHNFCSASVSGSTGSRPGSAALSISSRGQQASMQGGHLYKRLTNYVETHLASLLAKAPADGDVEIINYYNQCWARFTLGANYLDHVFSYLNRHWVRHERDEGGRHRGIYDINTQFLVLWRDHFFTPLEHRLVGALLRQIERARDGHPINAKALQTAALSLVSIGMDEQSLKRTSLLFYAEHFENPFIAATEEYYVRESQKYLNEQGVVLFMRRADQRIQEEQQRVAVFLHSSSEERLIKVCERVLVEENKTVIHNEFWTLLSAHRDDDCRVLYKLLSKVPESLLPAQECLKRYVEEQGISMVDALVAETNGAPEARQYVQTLLEVYEYFNRLVQTAFDNSENMMKAVDGGCQTVINQNAVARPVLDAATGTRSKDSKTPELLARFSDSLLKKSSKNADYAEVEQSLGHVIRVLRYVDDKDVFEKHYSRMLSRRLVNQTSASQELERSMVTRLSELCGFEYTNQLERMFTDIVTSAEVLQNFRVQHPTLPTDFTPFVLAESFWPLPYHAVDFQLPEPLRPTFDAFEKYYSKVHGGRVLKWLWNFGKGELKVNFAKSSRAGYILQVSAYQMAILLAFNNADTLTIDELRDAVKLPQDLVAGSLTYIVRAHVLRQTPADAPPGEPGTSYSLNTDFKSKKMRINLNLPLKSDTKQELKETQLQIAEDRNMFLQAVIVRIMKARHHLNHAQLVEETMQQSRKRFNPAVRDIKKAIGALIDKEYLQRENQNEYRYLA